MTQALPPFSRDRASWTSSGSGFDSSASSDVVAVPASSSALSSTKACSACLGMLELASATST